MSLSCPCVFTIREQTIVAEITTFCSSKPPFGAASSFLDRFARCTIAEIEAKCLECVAVRNKCRRREELQPVKAHLADCA
jgi:hypothetical protein